MSHDDTAKEVETILEQRGIRAFYIPTNPNRGFDTAGINVWASPDGDYITTAWAPGEFDDAEWKWGDALEYSAPADASASDIVDLLIVTLGLTVTT